MNVILLKIDTFLIERFLKMWRKNCVYFEDVHLIVVGHIEIYTSQYSFVYSKSEKYLEHFLNIILRFENQNNLDSFRENL